MRKKHILGSILFYSIAAFSFYKLLQEQVSNDNSIKVYPPLNHVTGNDRMKFIKKCRGKIRLNKQVPQKLWTDHYKNPCFHKDGTLHCLPYFLVAGFPKCGTTDLFERMRLHPEFVAPKMKELHWLSRYRFLPVFRLNSTEKFAMYSPEKPFGLPMYTQMFSTLADLLETTDGQSNAISADFSPSTLWDNDVYTYIREKSGTPKYNVQNFVHQLNPCMKFIVMMRDPVERLYSDYLFLNHNNTAKGFHTKVIQVVKLYKSCLKTRSSADCFHDYKLSRKSTTRLRIGAYSVYLQQWLKLFPRDQFYFLRLEDYSNNTEKVLTEIFDFLDMGPVPDVVMESMLYRKPSNTRESRNTTSKPMYKKTHEILTQFYGPFNHNLSILLNDTKYLWHNS